MSQKYDIAMKNIFSDMADDIMSYFLGLTSVKIDELNIEFAKIEKRESDMIFKCTTDTGDIAVHIEFQSSNDNKMPYRMLRYAIEVIEKYNLMPYQVVIYLGRHELKMVDSINFNFSKENLLNYRYKIIDMGNIKFSEITQTNYYDLYSLLPLIDKKRREEEGEKYLEKCVKAIKNMQVDIDKKRNIAFKAEILAGIVYKKEVIERVFREVEKMFRLEESETYKMIIEKGIEKGIKKGIEKGIEKGKKEGKIAVAKKLLEKGMDIDEIAEITELSKEEIKKLLN
ncbi:Rpn family recombination-promoting nuclease/putative transposase [Thermoanaerobacter thermocopriae]|uniref:Rpn family recombination-promoting nuclease/putative transposase n=1 Tax=Thermoanaerobacter thermocopriae TaxID=29350 RepID=UPI00048CAA24|nr:Rpn family recombination-promoting nuclease/putative transposase [Thermoanaerobacter thermocopriae]